MHPSVILLAALRKIHASPEPDIGICGQVGAQLAGQTPEMLLSVDELLSTLFKRWPKYSGLRNFPIPDICRFPEDAYHNNDAFWDRNTSYGALRWELLEFCIDQLENEDHGT